MAGVASLSPSTDLDDRTIMRTSLHPEPIGVAAPEAPEVQPSVDATVGEPAVSEIPLPPVALPPIPSAKPAPSVGRVINALCYVSTGVFLTIAGLGTLQKLWYGPLIGVLFIAYGVKVFVTRTSYWIHSVIYLLPVFGLFFLWYSTTVRH